MLMSVGPLVFDLATNIDQYELSSDEDFARKDVIGIRKPFEHVGEGDETLTLSGKLFPEKLGGAGSVDALLAIKRTGAPQIVIRGDGKFLGWFLVTRVQTQNEYLSPQGTPRLISVEITLQRCDPPSAAAAFGSLISLFG
jgi:phage protein U